MQNAVLERRLDAIPVDIFGERERSLVVAIGVFVVNPLIAGMIVGRASSADCQHPPFEGDIHSIGATPGISASTTICRGFIDVGGRQEYRPRGRSLSDFCGFGVRCSTVLISWAIVCTPSPNVTQHGFQSSSAGLLPSAQVRFPGCHC